MQVLPISSRSWRPIFAQVLLSFVREIAPLPRLHSLCSSRHSRWPREAWCGLVMLWQKLLLSYNFCHCNSSNPSKWIKRNNPNFQVWASRLQNQNENIKRKSSVQQKYSHQSQVCNTCVLHTCIHICIMSMK